MKQQIVLLCLILVIGAKAAYVSEIGPFIINGTLAKTSPSHAHVAFQNAAGFGGNAGGSIISLTHILTAAHIIVGFVSWNVGVGCTSYAGLARHISVVAIAHPNYVEAIRSNDIGIIILTNPLALTANIQPIGLPQINQVLPFEYEWGRIYGFGATEVGGIQSNRLQVANQRVTNHTQCAGVLITAVAAQQFCAIDLTRYSNICIGDLGGGLIIPYRGVDLLVGIASNIAVQCNTNYPAAYVRVSYYRAWIESVTGVYINN